MSARPTVTRSPGAGPTDPSRRARSPRARASASRVSIIRRIMYSFKSIPHLPVIRATPERISAVLPGQNGRHQRAAQRTTTRFRSRPGASSSARLAAVRPASPRQERQQLGERAEGRPHQDCQSAQPDEPCCRDDQRKLDPVHGVSPDLGCRTPEEGLREKGWRSPPEAGSPRRGVATSSPSYRTIACRARVLGPGQALEPPDHARQREDPLTGAGARPAHPMGRLRMPLARSLSARQTRRPHAAARARPEAPDRRSPRLTPSARGTLGGPAPGREQSGDVVIPASQEGTRKPRALDCRSAASGSRFRPGEHDSHRRHRQEHEPCRHQHDHCCLSVVSIYMPYMPAGRVDRFPRG